MGVHIQTRWVGYFVAITATLIALLVRLQAEAVFDSATFMPFFMAILLSAWIGGLGPGLLATGIGALVGDWFLFQPSGSLRLDQDQALQLALYGGMGLAISLVC